jgi:hypothetical protein
MKSLAAKAEPRREVALNAAKGSAGAQRRKEAPKAHRRINYMIAVCRWYSRVSSPTTKSRICPNPKSVPRWVPFTVQLVYRDAKGRVTKTENYSSREYIPDFQPEGKHLELRDHPKGQRGTTDRIAAPN